MQIKPTKLVAALIGAAVLTLAGCGGGNDSAATQQVIVTSTMLSGTAAGGAAVIGNVIVTDSKGVTKGSPIEANGRYSIDVNGMTGPFMLKAVGTVGNSSVTYYSVATTADVGGTVNVTPFTDLIVSNIAANMAETYFSNPDNIAKMGEVFTPAKLVAAQTALFTKLQPVLAALGISNSIDLLRGSFAADHSGMDAVLDLVKVETDAATNIVTLKNAFTRLTIATDDVTKSADDATAVDSTKITGITASAATDLQTIVAKLNSFSALFATSLPTIDAIKKSGLFDTSANFMMSGQTFAQFSSELSTEQDIIGMKFSNIDISPVSSDVMILSAVMSSNTDTLSETVRLKMVKVDGTWLVQGDDRKADISIHARAGRSVWKNYNENGTLQNSGGNSDNGLSLYIEPFAYNSNNTTNPIVSALVTGPGLGNGVTLVQDIQNKWLKLSESYYSSNLVPDCEVAITNQCVDITKTVDNGEYVIILKNAAGESLNGTGYTVKLTKKPYTTNELRSEMFPAFTSITIDGRPISQSALVSNKSISVKWTMPKDLKARYASVWSDSSAGEYFRIEKQLLPDATSALFGLGTLSSNSTPYSATTWLEGVDAYGRRLSVSEYVSIQTYYGSPTGSTTSGGTATAPTASLPTSGASAPQTTSSAPALQ